MIEVQALYLSEVDVVIYLPHSHHAHQEGKDLGKPIIILSHSRTTGLMLQSDLKGSLGRQVRAASVCGCHHHDFISNGGIM